MIKKKKNSLMMFKMITIKQTKGREKRQRRRGFIFAALISTGAAKSRKKDVWRKKIYFVFDDVFVIIIRITFSFFLEMKCYKIDQFFHGYGVSCCFRPIRFYSTRSINQRRARSKVGVKNSPLVRDLCLWYDLK